MIRACPHCGANNRIPAKHLAHTGRCGRCREMLPPLDRPLEVDATAFDEILAGASVPVLVDFWAAWCGPCKMAAPELDKAAAALAGRALVLKVNTEREPALASRYGVRSIPYFAAFEHGRLARHQAGLIPAGKLEQLALGAA